MNKLIQKTANTVVANLDNTTEIGLFKGKMGLTIFLYEYAKYSGNSIYGKIADRLIDNIYSQIKPDISPSVIDGSAGIGFGLSYLLSNHFIEGEPDNALHEVDERLLDHPQRTLLKEMTFQTPVFSSGLYLISRLSSCNTEQKNRWINKLIETGIFFICEITKRKRFEPKLSLLNSMFLVYNRLLEENIDKENVFQLQRDLLLLSIIAIEKRHYQSFDILLLKEIIVLYSENICYDYKCRLESVLSSISIEDFDMEEWNNCLWWNFVYDINFFSSSREDIKSYVTRKLLDYSFDIDVINNQFSILGLMLLKSHGDENEEKKEIINS